MFPRRHSFAFFGHERTIEKYRWRGESIEFDFDFCLLMNETDSHENRKREAVRI